ncbi:sulfite exporter TauE/SafE family protein [Streptomyces sp. NPDC059373]
MVGLALGALGGGGSVLAVPTLIYLLGFTPAGATTASLIIVTATSATALVAHALSGNVHWRTGLLFAGAGLLPAAAAGALSARLPQAALTMAIGALRMLTLDRPDSAREPAPEPVASPGARRRPPGGQAEQPGAGGQVEHVPAARAVAPERVAARPTAAAGAGAALGALTGLLGVGGGFLAASTLVSVVGLRMRVAVGTSLLVITANSATALTARAGGAGGLDWAVVGPFTAAAILGAWDGKRLAAKVSGPVLQRVFAVLLLAVALFMAVDALL